MALHGEITEFVGALGSKHGATEIARTFALSALPSRVDEYREDGVSVTYLAADEAGTVYVFEDDVLTTVFLHPVGDGGDIRPYPRPDSLIEGLGARASRDDVRAIMDAEPERSGGAFDRWRVGDRFVHFEFAGPDGALSLISLMTEAP